MRLRLLQLFDYRNFHRLSLSLLPGPNVLLGANAQGKTNLLEAIYLLATMKELRAETEAQLVRREAADDPLAAARIVGEAETAEGALKVEVAIVLREGANGPVATKTVKVNGVPKRVSDAIGRLTAVLFTAADIDLVSGSPAGRRRYLDITLSQVDRHYVTARSRFERVLAQRNQLLKRIREGPAARDELAFWDGELSRDGAYILAARAAALSQLSVLAADAHASLAPSEQLRLEYRPRLDAAFPEGADAAALAELYGDALRRGESNDIAAGMTLLGPHRDDVAFFLDGASAAAYASRAQQRTIALALRLAEAGLLERRRGEPPVVLLDDVLSEMDASRCRTVIEAVSAGDQVLVTATDADRMEEEFLERANVFSVSGGAVSGLSRESAPDRRTAEI